MCNYKSEIHYNLIYFEFYKCDNFNSKAVLAVENLRREGNMVRIKQLNVTIRKDNTAVRYSKL